MACEKKVRWEKLVQIGGKKFKVEAISETCIVPGSEIGGYPPLWEFWDYLRIKPMSPEGKPVDLYLIPVFEEKRTKWIPQYKWADKPYKLYSEMAKQLGLTKKELQALMGYVSGF